MSVAFGLIELAVILVVVVLVLIVIGVLIFLALRNRGEACAGGGKLKKCPFCAEMIKVDAIVCRYCGRDQPANPL